MMTGAIPGEVRVVDHVALAFAELVASIAPTSLAISGGATARHCYEQLAVTEGIAWEQIEVFVSDERWVPIEDSDSNEGVARLACFDGVRPKALHSMRLAGGTHADIETAAAAYDALMSQHLPLDLLHLGFGSDGHTASLFPGSPACAVDDRLVVATGDDLHPWPRLTFTFPAIARCSSVVVTVSGTEKAEILRALADGADMPAAHLRAADNLIWLIDRSAAAGLSA